MAMTVAAIDPFPAHCATIPRKGHAAGELTRAEGGARVPAEIAPCRRVNQGPKPRWYIYHSRCGEQLNPQLAHFLPEVLPCR